MRYVAEARGRLGVVAEGPGMMLLGRMGLLDLERRVLVLGVSIHSGWASKEKFGKTNFRLGLQKLIPKYVRFAVNAVMALIAAMSASLPSGLSKRRAWCFADLVWML